MKKRLLSAILSLCMIFSMLPAMALTAGAADESSGTVLSQWSDMENLPAGTYILAQNDDIAPTDAITVNSGVTLTVSGSAVIKGGNKTLFTVKNGGHLILDGVTITGVASANGAVYVEAGGTLEFGLPEERSSTPPTIKGNTTDGTDAENHARNVVISDGATVLLNSEMGEHEIGLSYAGTMQNSLPKVLVKGGETAISEASAKQFSSDLGFLSVPEDIAAASKDDPAVPDPDDKDEYGIVLSHDYLVLQRTTTRILYWSPIGYWESYTNPNSFWKAFETDAIDIWDALEYKTKVLRGTSTVSMPSGDVANYATTAERVGLADYEDKLSSFDMVFINAPYPLDLSVSAGSKDYNGFYDDEVAALKEYLNNGGRVFIQVEVPHYWDMLIYAGTDLAKKLGAEFEITTTPIHHGAYTEVNRDTPLANGLDARSPWEAAAITTPANSKAVPILTSRDANGQMHPWMIDQPAGSRDDGAKWGNITVVSDANYLKYKSYEYEQSKLLFQNLLGSCKENMASSATGYNPNEPLLITARTGHTLTFTGERGRTYTVIKCTDANGTPDDTDTNTYTITAIGKDGTYRITGLEKNTYYKISSADELPKTAVGKTLPVDAKDIAEAFETADIAGKTSWNEQTDETESAENANVTVSVGEDGNYVVDVKKDINKTIDVPDTWGTVTIDLGKSTIKGDNATDAEHPAKPGINFVATDTDDKPGTNLIIKNGKVEGGDGSPQSPAGAPGIKAPSDASPKPGIDAGPNATIKGGDGATGTDGNGGNGGSGISGGVDVTVEKESNIQGGNGGDGKPGDGDTPGGKGGDGGNSIDPTTNQPTINGGTTTGGNGGAGGSNGGQGGGAGEGNTPGKKGETNNGSLDSTTTTVIVKNPTNGLIYKIFDENGKEIDGITEEQVRTGAGEDLTFTGLTPNTWYTVKAYEKDAEGKLTQKEFAGDGKIQTKPQSSGGHHSSSTVSKNFTITATAGNGGSISPSGKTTVAEGGSKSFTITVNDGYEIADVLVDGASIGTKMSYTFEKVSASHTIEVKFRKVEQVIIVTDPSITGVANWLETDDHVVYLHGYPDRSFRPENPMTRAEAAQMFYNLLLNKDVEKITFTDVADDAWYATAVETLASIGVIKGVGNDQFAPERAITRAEFAAIATRFAKADDSGSVNFKDVKTSDWFYGSVRTAVSYGWLNGYTDGTFRPLNTITRTEVTAIVNRMLARAGDTAYAHDHGDVMKHFTDVTDSFWGYSNIIEATNQHDYTKTDGVESWK